MDFEYLLVACHGSWIFKADLMLWSYMHDMDCKFLKFMEVNSGFLILLKLETWFIIVVGAWIEFLLDIFLNVEILVLEALRMVFK